MLKRLLVIPLFLLVLFPSLLHASPTTENYNREAQIILSTIQDLEKGGYITEKNAVEARKEFVFSKPEFLKPDTTVEASPDADVTWTEYITLSGTMKTLAVIFLLIAFRGFVMQFIVLFAMVPQEIYQISALATSIMLTFHPHKVMDSESLYLSIFGVVANVIILWWIAATHEKFVEKIAKLISLNMPPQIVLSAYATAYFGFFAIFINSWFLGIIAAITFVGMFTFTMSTSGICTFIGFDNEDFIVPGMLTSLLILCAYSFVTITGITVPYLEVFSVGIEYVITIVLTISLVILTSFVFEKENTFWFSILIFIATFLGANAGGILYGLNVIPAIVNTGFVLFFMGWLHYFTFKVSGILTMFVAGASLYGAALLIEANPEYFVTALF